MRKRDEKRSGMIGASRNIIHGTIGSIVDSCGVLLAIFTKHVRFGIFMKS